MPTLTFPGVDITVDMKNAVPYFYASADEGSIRAEAVRAHAAGGGIVVIPPVQIALTSPLPFLHGVKYKGTGWQANFNTVGTGDLTKTGGTILKGDGTFPAFAGNDFDSAAAQVTFEQFINGDGTAQHPGMIRGCGVSDVTMYDFTYGIKMGGLYTPACQHSEFRNLNFVYCNKWSLSIENPTEIIIDTLCINFPQRRPNGAPADGMIYIGASGGYVENKMYTGNLDLSNVYAARVSSLTRGMVFEARGASSTRNNLIHVGKNYICGASPTLLNETAQTITGVSGADITINDASMFPVGMPVVTTEFNSGSVPPNTIQPTYVLFVVSRVGNVIQLGSTPDGDLGTGAPLDATGLSGPIKSLGYAKVELIGRRISSTDRSYVLAVQFDALDTGETSSTCDMLFYNASHNIVNAIRISPQFSDVGSGNIATHKNFAFVGESRGNQVRASDPATYYQASLALDSNGVSDANGFQTMISGTRMISNTVPFVSGPRFYVWTGPPESWAGDFAVGSIWINNASATTTVMHVKTGAGWKTVALA